MAESIFVRVQRVLSTGVESATDALERASGPSLMREAVREVDRAMADIRAEQQAATARRLQIEQQQKQTRARRTTLEEQARYALGKGREDLATAALSQQLECDTLLDQLKATLAGTADDVRRLEDGLAALKVRKIQMDQELVAFEAAQRAAAVETMGPTPMDQANRRVHRAEDAFERLMAAAGGAKSNLTGTDEAAKLAEIDALQREDSIADRLAILKAAMTKAPASKKGKTS